MLLCMRILNSSQKFFSRLIESYHDFWRLFLFTLKLRYQYRKQTKSSVDVSIGRYLLSFCCLGTNPGCLFPDFVVPSFSCLPMLGGVLIFWFPKIQNNFCVHLWVLQRWWIRSPPSRKSMSCWRLFGKGYRRHFLPCCIRSMSKCRHRSRYSLYSFAVAAPGRSIWRTLCPVLVLILAREWRSCRCFPRHLCCRYWRSFRFDLDSGMPIESYFQIPCTMLVHPL